MRTGRSLPQALELARALRPFKERFRSTRHEFAVDATVERYAETGRLTPLLAPVQERWFSVDVVVDQSASMRVWEEVVTETIGLLRQLGAFRTVERWHLDPQIGAPVLSTVNNVAVSPDRLRDPQQRRLVIVVSDCVAGGWRDPTTWTMLRTWATSTHTALLNPLPPKLWRDTGLDHPAARLRSTRPGAPNTDLRFAVSPLLRMTSASEHWLAIPVAGLSAVSIGQWARTVMAASSEGCEGVLMPLEGRLSFDDDFQEENDLVGSFRLNASPLAWRIATLCATQEVIPLGVMGYIQRELVPSAQVSDLAEVIVSGLFKEVSGTDASDLTLEFRDGVADRLRLSLSTLDAWSVHDSLSSYIEHQVATHGRMTALAEHDAGELALPDRLKPYAHAAAQSLKLLEPKTRAAQRVREAHYQGARRQETVLESMTFHAETVYLAASGGVAANMIGGIGAAPVVPFSVERAAFAQSVAVPPDVVRGGRLRGRSGIVEGLLDSFEGVADGGRSLLLHGLGGSGKTSIAAEVGRRLSAKDVDVWWVSAVDHARLVTGMHAVGHLLGVSAEELRPGHAAEAVWRRLNARTRPWLLVVDNADDPDVFDVTADGPGWADGWIRPVLNRLGLLLVTSRRGGGRTQPSSRLRPVPVDMLDPDDGAQVLLDHTNGRGGDRTAARALAQRLGGLPLALTLAGSYLAQSVEDLWVDDDAVTTFQDFHAALDLGRTDLLSMASQHAAGGAGPVVDEVWRMAVRLLEKRGLSLAGRFMRLLAQFAAAPLPYGNILRQRALFDSPVFAGLDRDQAGSLLHESANLGLFTVTTAAALDPADAAVPVLRLNPLMRDASHRYLDPVHGDDDYLTTAARLLVASVADEPDWSPLDHTRWNFWALLAPHAFHLLTALARTDIDPMLVDRVAHAVDQSARHLYVRGLRAQAEIEYQAMLRTCRHAFGDEHERTLAARHGIALIVADKGDFAAAQVEYEVILDLRRRVLGEEHPDTLSARGNLAGVLRAQGDLATAQTELQAVLDLRRRVLGEEHPDTLSARGNLAGVLRAQGDFAAAQTELQAVLDLRRRVLGEEHPDTLSARGNLANVLRAQGDFATAQTELQAVLDLRRRVLGEEHPDTLSARGNLAGVLRARGDLATAQTELQAVLDTARRVLGEEHPDTLTTRHNLAVVYAATGRYREADIAMRAVLAARQRVLGANHPVTHTTRQNLKILRKNAATAKHPIL